MNTLHLIGHDYYRTKMDRSRFLTMDAMATQGKFLRTGLGWPDWQGSLAATLAHHDFRPDLIVTYKPLQYPDLATCPGYKVVRYNEYHRERHDKEREVVDAALFHHQNCLTEFGKGSDFSIPHVADRDIFFDRGEPRPIDFLLVGNLKRQVYPLRHSILRAFDHLPGFRCQVLSHPGYEQDDAHTNCYAEAFAKALNSTKVACFCSSVYRWRFTKYAEAPACGAVIAADVPGENQEWFRQFIIELAPNDAPRTVAAILRDGIKQVTYLAGVAKDKCSHLSTDWYAKRLRELVAKRI